jgi:hypothetical protein
MSTCRSCVKLSARPAKVRDDPVSSLREVTMNPDRHNARRQAEQRLADAVRRRRELKHALAGRTGPPEVGDVFLFRGAALLPFRWAVVLRHPDRPLMFVVPADTAPFVGSTDVEVARQELGGAMVLRCASGLWLEATAFRPQDRVALLEPRYLDRAQAKLEQIAQGGVEATAEQREMDASPAYDQWLEEVAAAREWLASVTRDWHLTVSLREEGQILRLADPFLGTQTADAPQYDLAAAPELEGVLGTTAPEELRGIEVPHPCPGRLFLVPEDAGVGVRYLAAGGEEPPAVAEVRPDGQAVALAWKHAPGRFVSWAEVPFTQGRAVLRLGEGAEAREITVQP